MVPMSGTSGRIPTAGALCYHRLRRGGSAAARTVRQGTGRRCLRTVRLGAVPSRPGRPHHFGQRLAFSQRSWCSAGEPAYSRVSGGSHPMYLRATCSTARAAQRSPEPFFAKVTLVKMKATILLIGLAFAIVACSSGPPLAQSPVPTATPIPLPTYTPGPTPMPSATLGPTSSPTARPTPVVRSTPVPTVVPTPTQPPTSMPTLVPIPTQPPPQI